MGWHRRLWQAWALALMAAPAAALAQGLPTAPPPVRQTVDGNGVDLPSGALIIATPELSIGAGEAMLSYSRNLIGTGWADNTLATISWNAPVATVSFGGSSETFQLSGGAFTNNQGGGSTLAQNVTSSTCPNPTNNFVYTTAAGVAVCFQPLNHASLPYANYKAVSAAWPDGKVVTYTYQPFTYSGSADTRLASVTNNFGYQLTFTYASATSATVASVSGVNNAFLYCDPTSTSCGIDPKAWPTVQYAGPAGTPATVTVTDANGNATTFTYNASSQLVGITRPGSSAQSTSIVYDSSGRVFSVTNGARIVTAAARGRGCGNITFRTTRPRPACAPPR